MKEDRSRIILWSQNLSDGEKPKWRYGRGSVTFPNCGCKNYQGNGKLDLSFAAEWRMFVKEGFGLGWRFKWGTNASETTPDFAFHFGKLGDLYLSVSHLLPRKWLDRYKLNSKGEKTIDYDTRVFSFTIDTKEIRFQFWDTEGSWTRGQPWWYSKTFNYKQILFGKIETDKSVEDGGSCLIPMPEKNYSGQFEITKYVHHYQRPLGIVRDLILGPKCHYRTTITPAEPIPIPGKGENSWDCDDDAFYSSSIGGSNVEKGIGAMVESVLRTRRRHGGEHMSLPQEA
jgi:hypothetical protein